MTSGPDREAVDRSFVLRGLPDDQIGQLLGKTRRRTYKRGEVVFHEGDPGDTLHLIVRGRLKIVISGETGEEAILNIVGPGEVVGEMALLDGEPRSATVVALEPVETAVLNRTDFVDLLRASPAAVDGVLGALARAIRRLSGEVGGLMFLDLHGRLARKLLELADTYGRQVDDVIEVGVPLTQEELAGLVGATRPRVNKVLGFFEERGAISRRGRGIAILRPDLLRRWSAS